MPTWALATGGAVFLVLLTAWALIFTRTHPIEQEDPWQSTTPPSDPPPSSTTPPPT